MLDLIADHEIILSFKNKAHADQLFDLVNRNRSYLRNWMKWVEDAGSLEDIHRFTEQGSEADIYEPSFAMEIWYRNQLCGIVGFNNGNPELRSLSIGYWISEEFQGKGIATKSCKRIINFAFTDFDLEVMHLYAGTDNVRSRRVAHRLGFSFTGIKERAQMVNQRHIDLASYQLTRLDWHRLRDRYS